MSSRMLPLLALVVSQSVPLTPALGASLERTVTITDYLGIDWRDDLVHYSLEFPPGVLKGVATARVVTGGKAIPSQVSDVVRDDEGVIRSMNVWFFADVPANGAVSYTITPGTVGVTDAGVAVKSTPEMIELTTAAPRTVGIRLLNGDRTFRPVEHDVSVLVRAVLANSDVRRTPCRVD